MNNNINIMDVILTSIKNENINNIISDTIEDIITTIESGYGYNNTNYLQKKIVTFNDIIDVFYIPSIYDDNYYFHRKDIWWDISDYDKFRFTASSEVLQTMREQKINHNIIMTIKEAMNYLYQP